MKAGIYSLKTVETNLNGLGGKATNLAKLIQNGFEVPAGFVVSLESFDNGKLKSAAILEIKNLINSEKLYAVRSSALAEDSENESWAGQFESFLNVSITDVIEKIVECHNSKKARTIAYGGNSGGFEIAVVVQEMINPDYAGVIFTKNPITGADEMITEYIEGLGEDLVSGRKDPVQIVINQEKIPNGPFDIQKLGLLANKIVNIFDNIPQDIEYAVVGEKIYILQSRPITTSFKSDDEVIQLGVPEDLFFWGPSRGEPKYMSDFFAGMEIFYKELLLDSNKPQPPVTLCLFHDGKMVWLNRADEFSRFTNEMFKYYELSNDIDVEMKEWKEFADHGDLVAAFLKTEFAEFALYGAETEIIKRLERFDIEVRRQIITAFGTPDNETFLNRIDRELIEINNSSYMAEKYPWINDGYSGVYDIEMAKKHFEERVHTLNGEVSPKIDLEEKRNEILRDYDLTESELKSLELLKKLIEFMDNRKEWMMISRREIKESFGKIKHGWYFNGKNVKLISKEITEELYDRYVMFQSATGILKGIVASNGNHHFVSGTVAIAVSPTDPIGNDQILVCPMTSPSYVPLMRKAKALVTDHGGAMSHAAIVAREFDLPAIVGTKSATRDLKNGDTIMLNMLTGEIIK